MTYSALINTYLKQGLAADLPATPYTDANPAVANFYYATDTQVLYMYDGVAEVWKLVAFGDLTALQITFDNGPSGLSATDVQNAIDELKGIVDTLTSLNAVDIPFNNTFSGLAATNVQDAIDELTTSTGYSDERAQDAVGNALVDGTTINFTYNDGANTITGEVQNIATSHFATNVIDTDGTLAANSDTRIASQKAVKTYVDGQVSILNGTIAGIVGFTDEKAQDAVGTILTDSDSIDFTYDDAGGTITAVLAALIRPQGRLTPTTGTPYITSTVSGASTIYYTPAVGAFVPLWTGTKTKIVRFSEMSQALSDTTKSPAAAVANAAYYVVVWDDSGTLRATRTPAWVEAKTCTISIASPAVITCSNHGLVEGQPVVFSTTGALPTGITAGTVYYVIAAGFTTGQYQISTTRLGSAVNTSGSQSGTHTQTQNLTVVGTGAGTAEISKNSDGYWTNKYDITNGPVAGKGTVVGAFFTNASGTVDMKFGTSGASGGEGPVCGIANIYNLVEMTFPNWDTVNYNYTTATIRVSNNNFNNVTQFICALNGVNTITFLNQAVTDNSSNASRDSISLKNSMSSTALVAPTAASGSDAANGYIGPRAHTSMWAGSNTGWGYCARTEQAQASGTCTWACSTTVRVAGSFMTICA